MVCVQNTSIYSSTLLLFGQHHLSQVQILSDMYWSVFHHRDKTSKKINLKEERFILAYSLRDFSSWLAGSIALCLPKVRQNVMAAEVCGGRGCSAHRRQMTEREKEK
jgi:hypothetical protein